MSNLVTYVENIHIVKNLLEEAIKSKLHPLLDHYYKDFVHAPAATTQHHNFTHGLVIHTAEVMQTARMLWGELPDGARITNNPETGFTQDELFVAVFLHDFAKIKQYEPCDNHSWKKVDMICNQECWTLRELAKFGIELTDNELVGLLHAEGGYTEFDVKWRPISAVVHAADLWSSQSMRYFWNPAEAIGLKCNKCGADTVQRRGPRGMFYGCSKYPNCNGIIDASEVPSMDSIFEEWLKKKYPVDVEPVPQMDIKAEDLPF